MPTPTNTHREEAAFKALAMAALHEFGKGWDGTNHLPIVWALQQQRQAIEAVRAQQVQRIVTIPPF